MMDSRKTIWIVVVVLILGALVYWWYVVDESEQGGAENPITENRKDEIKQQETVNKYSNTMKEENKENEIVIKNIVAGTGTPVQVGDTVSVEYTGKLEDGTVFDASERHGKPLEFTVGAGMMIAGFDEGVRTMKVGESRTIVIPAELAYGDEGIKGPDGSYVIPPNATIIFEVKLVEIK